MLHSPSKKKTRTGPGKTKSGGKDKDEAKKNDPTPNQGEARQPKSTHAHELKVRGPLTPSSRDEKGLRQAPSEKNRPEDEQRIKTFRPTKAACQED